MKAVQRAATIGLVATAMISGPAVGQSTPDLGSATGEVSVLMIGWADQDGIDATTGKPSVGIGYLKTLFETQHPDIQLNIINIPWGSGSTGYAPKTESMVQANEACVYDMPGSFDYAHRGLLQDLDVLIAQDATFQDVWEGQFLETAKGWTPENPTATIFIPGYTGVRVIHWDAKLFEDWGVEPLSASPTVDEIATKAAATTGINPVTGEQNYGYWYQGKYTVWQFQSLAHAMGANWGTVNADGSWTVQWDTPEYLAALEKFLELAAFAPAGSLAADAMPQGFLTDQNVVSIVPEGEAGYFIQELINQPELQPRFRTSYNLKGADGLGGLSTPGMFTMAASCSNKLAAWEVLKFLTSNPDVQRYYFQEGGDLPTVVDGTALMPELAALPDAEIIATEPATEEARYPWAAAEPRWALQTALEGALAGTLTPKAALEQAQTETDAWLAQQ